MIGLALIAALGWGAADYFGGDAMATTGLPVFAVVALAEAIGCVVLIPIVAAGGGPVPAFSEVAAAGAAGISVTFELALIYTALSRGAIFATAPVGAIGAALAAGVGLVCGVQLDPLTLVGLASALLGSGLISWTAPASADRATLPRDLAVALAAAACVCAALSFLHAAGRADPYWATAIEHATTASSAAGLALVSHRRRRGQRLWIPKRITLVGWRAVILTALTGTIGDVTYVAASHHGSLPVVAAIGSLYPAATIALGSVITRSRATAPQLAGVLLALAGAGLLGAVTG